MVWCSVVWCGVGAVQCRKVFFVFEVYSYLLRRLLLNRESLDNLVYLYIMNTIIIIVVRDSTFFWAAYG